MQKIIEFANKVALNENANIPDINKVKDSDINEIKAVVNGSLQGTNAMGSIVVDDVNCKNLFDNNTMIELTNKYRNYNSGDVLNANGYYGLKIPVEQNTTYVISSNLNRNQISNLIYYNGNTYISGLSFNTGSLSFTTPSNCNYITLAVLNTYSWFQLEKGSTATNYVEYKQPVKKTNVGVKESCTFYANDFKSKNLFIPTKTNNGTNIALYQATLNMEDDEFVFTATGTAIYFGNVKNTGDNYVDDRGILIDVEGISSISYTLTNPLFNQTYITRYDSTKKSLGYVFRALSSGSYDIPAGTKYITLRFGINNTTSGTVYRTKVQLEVGSEPTSYTPYKNFDNTINILWTNTSPTSAFAGQQITLNDNVSNYSYYEIIYRRITTGATQMSSGRIPTNLRAKNDMIEAGFMYSRTVSTISGSNITFGDAVRYDTYGGTTTSTANTILVPYIILGYK